MLELQQEPDNNDNFPLYSIQNLPVLKIRFPQ